MAHALSRTAKLKVGTGVSVLPGPAIPSWSPRQLASLAGLAPGTGACRSFGLRARPAGMSGNLFSGRGGQRAAVFDESLEAGAAALLRQDTVSFAGEFFTVEGARASGPLPAKPRWTSG